MSEFLTTGVPADKGSGAPAEGNIFSGSQWGGPDSWDGPVWSEKYHKYVTQKDKDFDDAEEAIAKKHAGEHNDELHQEKCPCSVTNHHASYVKDIKRRVEPIVENINQLERQVTELSQQVKSNNSEAATKEHHQKAMEESVSKLKAHVHDLAQKMHSIVMNAERGITSLGKIDQGNKDEVLHMYRTETPK